VDFSGFTAAWEGERVNVGWGTTTEISNSTFTLFRSADLQSWQDVAAQPNRWPCASHSGAPPTSYAFTDTQVISGTTYYYRIQYSGTDCGIGSAVYLKTARATGGLEGQAIALRPGWQLTSFRVEPVLPAPPLVLGSIEGRYDRVLGEAGTYAPGLEPMENALTEMHAGLAYYLHITDTLGAAALIEGTPLPVTRPIALHAGWNWVGYLPKATLPLSDALRSIQGLYQRVLGMGGAYDSSLPLAYRTLWDMRPGQGYLVLATGAAQLVYPLPAGPAGDLPEEEDAAAQAACAGLAPTPYMTLAYRNLCAIRSGIVESNVKLSGSSQDE
jgi:hypothetical protein